MAGEKWGGGGDTSAFYLYKGCGSSHLQRISMYADSEHTIITIKNDNEIVINLNPHQISPLPIRRYIRMTGMEISEAVFSTNTVYFPLCAN